MMATPPQAQQTGNDISPRILYFISRSNGTLVPLIPADELPFNVRLLGVPRVLGPDQIHGLQHVGSVPSTGLTFKLEQDAVLQRSNNQPPISHTRNYSGSETMQQTSAYITSVKENSIVPYPTLQPKTHHKLSSRPLSAPLHELATTWRQPPTSIPTPDKTQDMIDAIINTPSGAETAARIGYTPKSTAVPPSGKLPNLDAKVYCTYWVRHGECDYTQQGCLYKHEMPGSLEELKAIGVKGWPDWWKQKNAQLKFGMGKPMVVGPICSVAEWLKEKKGEESDEEAEGSGHESEGEGNEFKKAGGSDLKILKRPDASVVTTKPSAPLPVKDTSSSDSPHKPSLTGDLISFTSLSPTLTPSTISTPNLTSSTTTPSTTGSRTITNPTPSSDRSPSPSPQKPSTSSPRKIFIPRNETPEPHITDFKKRDQATKRSVHADEIRVTTTAATAPPPPLQKQIQELQKEKARMNGGLAASKHAGAAAVVGQGEKEKKGGCGGGAGQARIGVVRKRVPRVVGGVAGAVGKVTVSKQAVGVPKVPVGTLVKGADGGR